MARFPIYIKTLTHFLYCYCTEGSGRNMFVPQPAGSNKMKAHKEENIKTTSQQVLWMSFHIVLLEEKPAHLPCSWCKLLLQRRQRTVGRSGQLLAWTVTTETQKETTTSRISPQQPNTIWNTRWGGELQVQRVTTVRGNAQQHKLVKIQDLVVLLPILPRCLCSAAQAFLHSAARTATRSQNQSTRMHTHTHTPIKCNRARLQTPK